MELFYHVSRDIELPRATHRVRAFATPRRCEACDAELEGGEPSEGGTYGLTFCADCRARLDRSAIQIHFCDGCGVSVSRYAVEGGAALEGDGRILCDACKAPGRGLLRNGPWGGRRLVLLAAALVALSLGLALGLLFV
jgi:hypothetical protein